LWPAACVIGVFFGVALLDVLPRLPDWLHAGVLIVFCAALLGALVWALPALRPIRHSEARARLERDSELPDRPLQALEDRLAAGREDVLAEALWRRHRERMAALAGALRVRWPDAEMSRHEPWGIRAGVLILLVIGAVAGSSDPAARLGRALDTGVRTAAQQAQVELWITPPAHTRVSPIYLTNAAGKGSAAAGTAVVDVPVASTLLARVSGVKRPPELSLSGVARLFQPLGEGNSREAWRAEATVDGGDRINVRTGRRELADWPISVVPDTPPSVAFDKPPVEQGDGLLALAWRAADDYGVTDISALIAPAVMGEPPPGKDEEPLRVPLPLAALSAAGASGTALQDLSAHAWAGTSVRIRLEAKDAAGQVGTSEAVDAVLPERDFAHPVARALITVRKTLLSGGINERYAAAAELSAIAAQPEAYKGDTVVSLALAVAKARLRLSNEATAIEAVRDVLWQTALRLEQGDVPLAERQLEEARQRLTDALQRQAPADEIERLMDELQQALDRYLAAAADEAARRGQLGPTLDPAAPSMRGEDLKDMIEAARQLMRSGGRETAMEMLAQLQRVLDSIRAGLRSGADADMAKAQELMHALRTLADKQQRLQDNSFRRLEEQRARQERGLRAPGRRPASPGPPSTPTPGVSPEAPSANSPGSKPQEIDKGGAAEQQALREELGALMLRLDEMLGSIPQPLGEADQAMKGAAESLGRGQLGKAFTDQSRAVDALERATQSAGEALARQLGNGMMIGGEGGVGRGDIFGRSPGGRRGFATGDVEIPDNGSLQRAQEILDELRRRAAERSRPVQELDYIERLLRRF
jgi:uncharacterized protein (TIGR02302 family)